MLTIQLLITLLNYSVTWSLETPPLFSLKFSVNTMPSLLVAEAISSSAKSRFSELPVSSGYIAHKVSERKESWCLLLLSTYNHGSMQAKRTRPATPVQLHGVTRGTTATYTTIYLPYADVSKGVTWAGQRYATKPGSSSGGMIQKILNVDSSQSRPHLSWLCLFIPNDYILLISIKGRNQINKNLRRAVILS
jgi:hypothetical protein